MGFGFQQAGNFFRYLNSKMMSIKSVKIIYGITTGLVTVILLLTIGNSIFNKEFSQRFAEIGHPTYLIIPLMSAKVLGLIAIWSDKSNVLKEWAYAGFFFLFVLALLAEIHASDADYVSPPLALSLLLTSYLCWKKIPQNKLMKSE